MTRALGLGIEVVWRDDELVEICVEASNGAFAASAELYVRDVDLGRLAGELRGFPTEPSEVREADLGLSPDPALDRGLWLHLASDSTGGVAVQVRLLAESADSARFTFRTESAAIDRFVRELAGLVPAAGARAHLAGLAV